MELKSITNVDVRGKRVILRAGLNVPTSHGRVVDDFRLAKAAQTISFLVAKGARVLLLGHLGREKESLRPVIEALQGHLPGNKVVLHDNPLEDIARIFESSPPKQIFALENVRRFEGEETNDPVLAEKFAKLGDVYVNDAFADSHREHVSIVGIPKHLPSYAGLLVEEEVLKLKDAREPQRPALAIVGGAKFETKEPLIEKLVGIYDRVCVGGAIVNDFFKAQGFNVGESLVSGRGPSEKLLSNQRIEIPSDIVAVKSDNSARTTIPADVRNDEKILDSGPGTGRRWAQYVLDAQFVLMNGPLGVYERGFNAETERLAHALTASNARAVVGGGDTIAAIQKTNFDPERIFLSTGGGAMLEFLATGTLVGLQPLWAKEK